MFKIPKTGQLRTFEHFGWETKSPHGGCRSVRNKCQYIASRPTYVDITMFDGYPLVIKHGLLENLPFGSMIFPAIKAINIQLWRCLWIFQPATIDDMDGISFYQIHIKCNYISMSLCHCTPLYLYYTYYIIYILFIHSIHSYSYSINIPWISHDFHRGFSPWKSWFITLWFQSLFDTYGYVWKWGTFPMK